jgi:hypothetical protein
VVRHRPFDVRLIEGFATQDFELCLRRHLSNARAGRKLNTL